MYLLLSCVFFTFFLLHVYYLLYYALSVVHAAKARNQMRRRRQKKGRIESRHSANSTKRNEGYEENPFRRLALVYVTVNVHNWDSVTMWRHRHASPFAFIRHLFGFNWNAPRTHTNWCKLQLSLILPHLSSYFPLTNPLFLFYLLISGPLNNHQTRSCNQIEKNLAGFIAQISLHFIMVNRNPFTALTALVRGRGRASKLKLRIHQNCFLLFLFCCYAANCTYYITLLTFLSLSP